MDMKKRKKIRKDKKHSKKNRWSVIRFHRFCALTIPSSLKSSTDKISISSLGERTKNRAVLRKKIFLTESPVQTLGKTELYIGSVIYLLESTQLISTITIFSTGNKVYRLQFLGPTRARFQGIVIQGIS